MEEYITDDLYQGAALIVSTGIEPDHYLRIHTNRVGRVMISLRWDDRSKLPISDLSSHKLRVEPLQFRDVHVWLKKKVLKIKDGERSNGSNRGFRGSEGKEKG